MFEAAWFERMLWSRQIALKECHVLRHHCGPHDPPKGEKLLMSWLQNANVIGVFLAPPCGSASRARQIPLKKRKFGGNKHGPRPLRSDKFLKRTAQFDLS